MGYSSRMRRILVFAWCISNCLPLLAQGDNRPAAAAHITFRTSGYAGMPIWMRVESDSGYKIHYPSSANPRDFYCNQVEVKKDDRPLAPSLMLPSGPRNGPACGWLGIADIAESELPIHLQYDFTQPGTYMVRFSRRTYQQGKLGVVEQSEWTALQLRPAPPAEIENWLTARLASLPNSAGRLLGDALPSLLASRDSRVLELMVQMSYHQDPAVALYAANSLGMFDPVKVRAQVLEALRQKGSNDALTYLLNSGGRLLEPLIPDILEAALEHMKSTDPVHLARSLHTLTTLRNPYFKLPDATLAKMDTAVRESLDVVIAQRNNEAAWSIANYLGQTRFSGSRDMLWRLIDAQLASEQSLICVTWFRDSSDLPRLSAIAKTYDAGDPHGYQHSSVVMHMQTQYGSAARPYLREILNSSKQTWVRTAAAQGLVQLNDRAGWGFFADMIREKPFYRDEMMRWLGNLYPDLRDADDATAADRIHARIAAASD